MGRYTSTIDCADCGASVVRTGSRQKRCSPCRLNKRREYNRQWHADNAAHVRTEARRRYAEDPTRRRASKLRRKYGLSLEQWETMLAAQGGLCAIRGCERPATDTDHDHTTGQVRALLCHEHNIVLHAHLTAEDFAALAEYLREH